jgi:hypothetical protein
MIADPIVEEVRVRGRALTARYHNDPKELLHALAEHARAHPETVVDTIRIVAEVPRKTA